MSLVRRISTYSPRYFILRRSKGDGLTGLGCFLFLLVCSLTTACLVFQSYPNRSHAWLAWLAWIPFFWGIAKIRRGWTAFLYGEITGFLFNTGIFYWIFYTCLHGGNLSFGLSVAAWLGLSALMAFPIACWSVGCFFVKRTGIFFSLLVASGFVAVEWLHQTIAFYGIGFPWIMWGYSQWNHPEVLQMAAFTGVYGISFLLILVSALLGHVFFIKGFKHKLALVIVALCILLGTIYWGNERLQSSSNEGKETLRVALVQPNIDQYKKWDPLFEQEILDTILQTGISLQNKGISLVVWPESVIPGELQEEPYAKLMQRIAKNSGSYQVVGSSVTQGSQSYVGAYVLSPEQESWQLYRKIKLVPFGEYIPWDGLIRKLFPQVEVLGELGLFMPGPHQQELVRASQIDLGSTICYEAIFPQLYQQQSRQGARIFVNLTNDAWFFNTAAPYQHFAANILRAIETGRPILRAANTGISAVIDPQGRIIQQTTLFEPALVQTQIVVPAAMPTTFYATHGDWFAWICVFFFVSAVIFASIFLYE